MAFLASLFAKKAAYVEHHGVDDIGHQNPDGSWTMPAPDPPFKLGPGIELSKSDPNMVNKFMAWKSKLSGSDLISTGDNTYVEVGSPVGKAQLVKLEMQVEHGYSEAQATKATAHLADPVQQPVPYKAWTWGKAAKAAPDSAVPDAEPSGAAPSAEPTISKGVAKANQTAPAKAIRGPNGPIAR